MLLTRHFSLETMFSFCSPGLPEKSPFIPGYAKIYDNCTASAF